jgi:RHS repeat-associated protein
MNTSYIESASLRTLTGRSCPLAFAQFVCLALLLWCPAPAPAQNVQHTENKPDQALKGDFRVDPSTLGMSITIPLGSYPGRGGLNVPLSLTYSSKVWRVEFLRTWLSMGTQLPFNELSPKYAENSVSGWTSSLDIPLIEFTGRGQYYDNQGNGVCDDCDPSMQTSGDFYIKRVHVHLPDGSSHELRASDSAQSSYPVDLSGVYHSVDAARLVYVTASSTLYLPDGSRYLFASTEISLRGRVGLPATSYIDRNGNTLSYNATNGQWTDTLGRAVANPLPAEAPADPVTTPTTTYEVKRVGGAPNMIYTFHWKRLANALTTSQNALRYTGSARCNYAYNPPSVSPALFASSGVDHVCAKMDAGYNAPELFNPVVLSKIDIPAGQSYTFTYNIYGEIEKVTLPTGGYERYVYGSVPTLSHQTTVYRQANRGVLERWISIDGSSAETRQGLYSVTTSSGSYTVRSTAYDNTYTERVLHASNVSGTGPAVTFGFDDPLAGKIKEERNFNSSNQMLRRTLTKWWMITPAGSSRPRNPYVDKTVSLILDTGGNALAATTTMGYDGDLNLISTSKYDYNASLVVSTAETAAIESIPNGALVRTDETTYLVNDAFISSTIRNLYRDRNLTTLPSSSRVKNASGTVVAQSEIKYDEAAYPLLSYATVTSWNDPGATIVRGLATTTRSWLDTSGAWLETHAQYDQTGNVRKAWDAKGNISEMEYSSAYHYAFPTLTKTPIPDPANASGTNTALVSTSIYDSATGRLTSTKDANGQVSGLSTTYEYNDAMGRLTKITNPDGGWTEHLHDRNAYGDYVRTRTAINTTQNTESYQYFDGLGRNVRSFQYDGSQSATVDTQYDAMGRAWRVSNPYFSAGAGAPINPSGNWTTTTYDALGRVSTVTTPDQAVVTTAHSGVQVMVTDQAGRVRKNVSDAFGRLTQVVEPNAAGSLTAVDSPSTTYNYDALGNLRQVNQGGQLRYFMYDSLSRLIRAKNPEQDAHAALATSADPVSGNTQWSLAYTYDNNGNVTAKTDARNVSIIYQYDNINRNTTVDYSDTATVNPDIMRYYDGAVGGRGRFWYNYRVQSNAWEHTAIDGYDSMGRAYQQRQAFNTNGAWSSFYYVTRSYDKMGHVTGQTYPSGRTVSYPQYDAAGRLKKFTGNLGDNTTRTYATGINPANGLEEGIQYDEAGRIRQERFGTQTLLYHKQQFNVRGQLSDIRLGLGYDTWSAERGAIVIDYGTTANNGNVAMQQYWIPTDASATAWNVRQSNYAYDSLNRVVGMQEFNGTSSPVAEQWYIYDQWGNRTINRAATSNNLPEPEYTVNPQKNQLSVPAAYSGVISYDAAGNQTYDSHSPNTLSGSRTYDAENRMTATYYTNNQFASGYTYDADGRRVRRKILGSEMWQVYGIDGEMLAEYAAAAAPSAPQKEYGYRNGELLVTAESGGLVNWLVRDHLGTPRMIGDQTGSLTGIKRHDYLPFGEEVGDGTGGRAQQLGYSADGVRQKFTGHERDTETGLDYMQARYYSPDMGRFASIDPLNMKADRLTDPQRIPLYVYTRNNPLKYIDPDGKDLKFKEGIKKADADKIINALAERYMRQGGYDSINTAEKDSRVITLGVGDVAEKPGSGPGERAYGSTKLQANDNIDVTIDFAQQDKDQREYETKKGSLATQTYKPESTEEIVNHEWGHIADALKDPQEYRQRGNYSKESEKIREKIQEQIKNSPPVPKNLVKDKKDAVSQLRDKFGYNELFK